MIDDLQTELRAGTVYQLLREAILQGRFEVGAPISQVKLAERLGVSRTPLREALRMLQREGLIAAEPNRRVRVAPLSVDDLEQVYAHRIVLEALALTVSVPRFDERDFADIHGYLETMHQVEQEHAARSDGASDLGRWEVPHHAFHLALRRYAGDRIEHEATLLADHSERYRRVYLADPSAWRTAGEEHEAIVAACEVRDVHSARRLLARHLARTALTVVASLAPEHDPARVRAALQLVTASHENGGRGA